MIVPCFDDGATLPEAIGSVRAQDERVELIVVDDGSSDPATLAVFEELERQGIRVLHQANAGLAAARMAGARATTARFVFPLDADDRLAPGALRALADALDGRPRLAAVWGDYEAFGDRHYRQGTSSTLDPWQITYQNDLPVASLFRRDALLAAGGWRLHGYEDWDLWMTLAEQGAEGRRVPIIAYHYRLHGVRMLAEKATRHADMYEELRGHHPGLFARRHALWRRSKAPPLLRATLPAIEALPASRNAKRLLAGMACHVAYGRGLSSLVRRLGPSSPDGATGPCGRRILIFAPYYPPHVGGVERYVADLSRHLTAHDEIGSVTILAPRLPTTASGEERPSPETRVLRYPAGDLIPNFPAPRAWSPAFWRVLALAHGERHDIVMSHTRFFLSSLIALAYARAIGVPLVHVEHGAGSVHATSVTSLASRLYDATAGRLVLRAATRRVAISAASRDFIRRLAGVGADVIYSGVERDAIESVTPATGVRRASGDRHLVVFLGRLIEGKGVRDLVAAIERLGRRDLECWIVGDGPQRPALEELTHRLGLEDLVTFAGARPAREAIAIVKAADIVVNPSYIEGLSLSIIEAAVCGKAIVASRAGGTPEVVTDGSGALFHTPGDVDGLAGALRRLLDDAELRARLGAYAREEAIARFDWDRCAEQFAAIFASVGMESTPGRGGDRAGRRASR